MASTLSEAGVALAKGACTASNKTRREGVELVASGGQQKISRAVSRATAKTVPSCTIQPPASFPLTLYLGRQLCAIQAEEPSKVLGRVGKEVWCFGPAFKGLSFRLAMSCVPALAAGC